LKGVFFKKIFFPCRGFIGAIGDDLPSLIPIVFALLLFFTVFSATLNNYETKNEILNEKINLISISRQLKGDSLLLSLSQFKTRCDRIRVQQSPYNFMVGVYLIKGNSTGDELSKIINCESDPGESFNEGDLLVDSEYAGCESSVVGPGADPKCRYFCDYTKFGSKAFSCSQKNYIVRFYPVAVQTKIIGNHSVIAPAIMAMVVWE
jgi:hypothetical protein